jgi:hypothetical protein
LYRSKQFERADDLRIIVGQPLAEESLVQVHHRADDGRLGRLRRVTRLDARE